MAFKMDFDEKSNEEERTGSAGENIFIRIVVLSCALADKMHKTQTRSYLAASHLGMWQ